MSGSLGSSNISFLLVTFFLSLTKQCSGFGDSFDSVEWWETSLIYEISPGAYQDSDGNGQGDLQGILTRLDYIKALGVQTICLNPIYPSPFIDAGYDVMDYKDIDPIFGSLSDFDELVKETHKRDMKIILDVVPNHSSDKHTWFIASVDQINPYTNYYVWANGTTSENGTRLPPNNWLSAWDDGDDSAWTWNEKRDQWYYHKYHESEPDLNFHNADVRLEIMYILEFWLNREVDGFRIFGIPYLFEDPDLRDEPILLDPQYTFGLQENIDFSYHIRRFVDHWTEDNNSTSKLLAAGSCDTRNNSVSYYGGEDNASPGIQPLNCLFTADIDITSSNASEFENGIEEWLGLIPPKATTNWMLTNDVMNFRIASRVTSARLDALHILIMLLPGQAFTYYGDEIGMKGITSHKIANTLSKNQTSNELLSNNQDSVLQISMRWVNSNEMFANESIDDDEENKNAIEPNVQDQLQQPNSHLNVYKKLAELRKDPVFERGDWNLESLNDDAVLLLRRTLPDQPVYVVIINFAEVQQDINITQLHPDLDDYFDVVLSTSEDITNGSIVAGEDINLLPNAGLVLRSLQNDEENVKITEEEFEYTENTKIDSMELTTWTKIDDETTTELTTSSEVDELTTESTMSSEIDEVTTTESINSSEVDKVTTTESVNSFEVDEVTTTELVNSFEVDEVTTTESVNSFEVDEVITTESVNSFEVDEVITTESINSFEVDEVITTEPINSFEVDEVTTTLSTILSEVDEVTTTEPINSFEVDEITTTESTPASKVDEVTVESNTWSEFDKATTIKSMTNSTDQESIGSTNVNEFGNVTTQTTTPNSTTSSACNFASYERALLFQMCISFTLSYYLSKVC